MICYILRWRDAIIYENQMKEMIQVKPLPSQHLYLFWKGLKSACIREIDEKRNK